MVDLEVEDWSSREKHYADNTLYHDFPTGRAGRYPNNTIHRSYSYGGRTSVKNSLRDAFTSLAPPENLQAAPYQPLKPEYICSECNQPKYDTTYYAVCGECLRKVRSSSVRLERGYSVVGLSSNTKKIKAQPQQQEEKKKPTFFQRLKKIVSLEKL